jgi:hypothetical protein
MTEADAEELREALDAAQEAYVAFTEAWGDVGRIVRRKNHWLYDRVDAYPGWLGERDVGAGKSMQEWMDEVEEWRNEVEEGEEE